MFKAELEHQITLSSNEERIKDIENDAADAMDDNPNSVSSNEYVFMHATYQNSMMFK